jgi:Mor family transcriptional regulator
MNDNETFDQLTELIGAEAARQVAASFAGENLYIPKRVIVTGQHEAIRQEYRNGATYRELSIRYGYTTGYIRKLVNKRRGLHKG